MLQWGLGMRMRGYMGHCSCVGPLLVMVPGYSAYPLCVGHGRGGESVGRRAGVIGGALLLPEHVGREGEAAGREVGVVLGGRGGEQRCGARCGAVGAYGDTKQRKERRGVREGRWQGMGRRERGRMAKHSGWCLCDLPEARMSGSFLSHVGPVSFSATGAEDTKMKRHRIFVRPCASLLSSAHDCTALQVHQLPNAISSSFELKAQNEYHPYLRRRAPGVRS